MEIRENQKKKKKIHSIKILNDQLREGRQQGMSQLEKIPAII